MTDEGPQQKVEGLWARLRRHRTVQWCLAYAAAAWTLLQGLEYLTETYGWPPQIRQITTLALALGLPVVFAVAMYHGRRGRQRVSAQEIFWLSALVLLGGAALWVYARYGGTYEEEPAQRAGPDAVGVAADARPSIAVLPFENRSLLAEDAFFVDGIHDDVLTQLAKIGALKVIARTSVEQFRDTKLTAREIGEQLGATQVLEGGVQRAGNRVRINVQLIEAASDMHLWAETYDRDLTAANIFAIQTDVAAAIATALSATLTKVEQARLGAVPTQNLAAWEAYQLGKQRMARRTSEALEDAEQFFERAIELDEGFALAYVGLADTLALRMDYGGLSEADMMERATAAATRAIELDADLAEASTSAAWLAVLREDWAAAETGFRRAIELNPNYATAYHWCSRLFLRTGRYDEALRFAEKAAELDPLSAIINVNLGNAQERVGQFSEALAAYHKAIEIDPAIPNPYLMVGSVHANAFGRLDRAAPWYEKAASLDADNPTYALALASLYLDLGDGDRARLWFKRAGELGDGNSLTQTNRAMWHLYAAERPAAVEKSKQALVLDARNSFALELMLGADGSAASTVAIRAAYERAYPELAVSDRPRVNAANYRAAIIVAFLLKGDGELERADLLLDGCETVIQNGPRMGWLGYRISDARILAVRGERRAALGALRAAELAGWRGPYWRHYRDFDAALESIRGEPGFAEIFASIERDMAVQRARLAERPPDAPLDFVSAD